MILHATRRDTRHLFLAFTLVFLFTLQWQVECLFSIETIDDPDAKKNVSELISSKGYIVEEYEVQTEDGYILSLQRIPSGKESSPKPQNESKVVLLAHGLLGSSADFVLNFENTSIAFVLADAGYDVWLANARGNVYSRKHNKFIHTNSDYWDFSIDEMALYDLPATIDFILRTTRAAQLAYIGYSQGNTIAFALLAEKPEYNAKISVLIAMSPAVFESHAKGALTYMSPFTTLFRFSTKLFGHKEFLPTGGTLQRLSEMTCKAKQMKHLCSKTIFLIGGIDFQEMNETRLAVYTTHLPAGTSTKNIIHFTQLIKTGNFQKYDYSNSKNMDRYNQKYPPQYDLKTITTPVAIIWSDNDYLSEPKDVELLKVALRKVVSFYKIEHPKWNHFDFIWGLEANKYLYGEMFRVLEQFKIFQETDTAHDVHVNSVPVEKK